MGYILRDEVLIKRPIIFLCGPYFKKGNKSDRRYLLRKCFRKHYRDGVLPLIIDDFLTEDNIKDSNVNIQLLEEIFAAISCKTYIFLDTLSAASELGLFMNHAFTNSVVAYVPKESDILNKSNVGYFVKDVILKMNSEQAKCIEYRPAITRSVISSDYAVEHYGFIADIVPENIEKEIASDIIFKDKKEKSLYTEENEQYPDDDFHIFYKTRDGKTILHISIGMLFDVVMSLMYELNQSKLVTNKEATIADFNVDAIQRITKEVFLNYLIKKGIHCGKEIELYTKLSYSFDTIVYHMVTFCYIYHCYSTYRGLRLVDKHMDTILDTCEEINAIETRTKIQDRMEKIREYGGKISYADMSHKGFKRNLIMVDSSMPEILGNMLLYFYAEDIKDCKKLVAMAGERDPLGYGDAAMYEYKFKKFLCSCALGLKPAKPWDGLDEANGGYIIVKADGEVLAYHIYNRNFFEQYLLDNTICERASTGRHEYMSLYEENGQMYIKLNLQVRFK